MFGGGVMVPLVVGFEEPRFPIVRGDTPGPKWNVSCPSTLLPLLFLTPTKLMLVTPLSSAALSVCSVVLFPPRP